MLEVTKEQFYTFINPLNVEPKRSWFENPQQGLATLLHTEYKEKRNPATIAKTVSNGAGFRQYFIY